MALDDDMALLAGAPLFNLLGRDALRLIAFAAERRALKTGEALFRRNDRADGGYVVLGGAIALDGDDDGTPDFIAEPGALIGQNALFARVLRPASAVAREASVVLRISPSVMRRVLEEFPDAAAALHQALALELSILSGGLEQVRRHLMAVGEVA